MFFAPEIFWGAPPKILDRRYKIRRSTDHRAKFQAGRPTHLGDLALNKKKLEIWGKAQRESARRSKSDWGKLGGGKMFLAPENFWGARPKILDRHYKFWPSTDHRAKFHAGRPTLLGDLALGEKIKNKKSGLKHKSFRKLSFSGGLIITANAITYCCFTYEDKQFNDQRTSSISMEQFDSCSDFVRKNGSDLKLFCRHS